MLILIYVFVAFGLSLISGVSADARDQSALLNCNQTNLVEQARCQVANAIDTKNYQLMGVYFKQGLTNPNDKPITYCSIGEIYAVCAYTDMTALSALFGYGMDPNITVAYPPYVSSYFGQIASFDTQLSLNAFNVFMAHGPNINALYSSSYVPLEIPIFMEIVRSCNNQNTALSLDQSYLWQMFKAVLPLNPNVEAIGANGGTLAHAVAQGSYKALCQNYFNTLMTKYPVEMSSFLKVRDSAGRVPSDYAISFRDPTTGQCDRTITPTTPMTQLYNLIINHGGSAPTVANGSRAPCAWMW